MVCSETQSLSQPWEWARGWQDVLEPAPTCPTQLCQHSRGQGRELKAGFQSQGEMWVSLRELDPSTASFELVEPRTLPAQLFSPSRPSLGFPSGGTGQRGAKRGTAKGKSAGSHRCIPQTRSIQMNNTMRSSRGVHGSSSSEFPQQTQPLRWDTQPRALSTPRTLPLSPRWGCPQVLSFQTQPQAWGKRCPKAAGRGHHTQS